MRPESPSTVYLDSSAVIAAIKREDGYEPIQRVLESAAAGRLALVTSSILLVEARGHGLASTLDEQKEKELVEFLDNSAWTLVELDRNVALSARDISLRRRMKNYDAIHLASAIAGEADVLMARDGRFPFGEHVEGVWVDRPYAPDGPDLLNQE